MLALWTVILLLVPAALLGKLYEPFICIGVLITRFIPTQYISRLSTPFTRYQLHHELPNSERPESHEIESNGSRNFLLRVVSLKHNPFFQGLSWHPLKFTWQILTPVVSFESSGRCTFLVKCLRQVGC